MARSLIIVCVALATLVHFHPAASAGMDIIKSNVNDAVNTAKGITTNIKEATASTAGALDDHLGTSELTTVLTGLLPDITGLVASLSLALPDSLKNALSIIETAVGEIKNAVLGVIPLLNGIVELLGALLQEILNLVSQVLGLVLDILGSLTGQLDTVVRGLLTQLTSIGDILVGKVGDVLSAQLSTITGAVGTIIAFLKTNVLDKVANLPKEILAAALSIVTRLIRVDNLIGILLQSVLALVFSLLAQLKGALEGLLKSVLGTLTNTLGTLTGCSSCLGGIGLLGRK